MKKITLFCLLLVCRENKMFTFLDNVNQFNTIIQLNVSSQKFLDNFLHIDTKKSVLNTVTEFHK
jgi:hypothetical protein